MTGGGLFGEPWDSVIASVAAITFIYGVWWITHQANLEDRL
jgi:G:T-mismatch repair DNA endonuclease (very short patch repair protein)